MLTDVDGNCGRNGAGGIYGQLVTLGYKVKLISLHSIFTLVLMISVLYGIVGISAEKV